MNEEIKEIYTEVWKLHKAHYSPKTDSEWEKLIAECSSFLKTHKCQFARDTINAMICEIENRCKNH